MTPTNQTAYVGSNIIFNCESTSKNQADAYRWFFKAAMPINISFDLSESIGIGKILELNHLTANNTGFIYCCNLFSNPSGHFSKECSSAELFVITHESHLNGPVFKLIVIGGIMFFFVVALAFVFTYRRYRMFIKTVKAQKTMHKVTK